LRALASSVVHDGDVVTLVLDVDRIAVAGDAA
jgi:hypothetical protein